MGLIKPNETKEIFRTYQNSNVVPGGAPSVLNDLTVSGLTIGETYRVTLNGYFSCTTNGGPIIRMFHNGAIIGKSTYDPGNGGGGASMVYSCSTVFTAVTTSVTFEGQAFVGGATIEGDGTLNKTNVIVETVPETSSFQKVYQSVNVNPAGGGGTALPDLTINTLVVGQKYRLTLNGSLSSNSSNGPIIRGYNGATLLTNCQFDAPNGGGSSTGNFSSVIIFNATSTSLTFTAFGDGTVNTIIQGNGSAEYTFATLELLVDAEEVSDF